TFLTHRVVCTALGIKQDDGRLKLIGSARSAAGRVTWLLTVGEIAIKARRAMHVRDLASRVFSLRRELMSGMLVDMPIAHQRGECIKQGRPLACCMHAIEVSFGEAKTRKRSL